MDLDKLYYILEAAFGSDTPADLFIHQAATGTIYICEREGRYKMGARLARISDHEPNFGAPGRSCKHYIYIKDACGSDLFCCYAHFVEHIAEILSIDMKPYDSYYDDLDFCRRQTLAAIKAAKKIEEINIAFREKINKLYLGIMDKGILDDIIKLEIEADTYGDAGSNGKKRRKRKASYFNREVLNRYGIDMKLYEWHEVKKLF